MTRVHSIVVTDDKAEDAYKYQLYIVKSLDSTNDVTTFIDAFPSYFDAMVAGKAIVRFVERSELTAGAIKGLRVFIEDEFWTSQTALKHNAAYDVFTRAKDGLLTEEQLKYWAKLA